MRLFFCVELDEKAKGRLVELMERLKAHCPAGKWVARENLHLTVRFLGEVGEDRVGELHGLARGIAGGIPPFTLELGKLSAFPSPRRARVLWAGPVRGGEKFAELMRAVEEGVRGLGFRPETREPTAHVTLARFKTPRDLSRLLKEVDFGAALPVEVKGLTLMRSTLRPEGPFYTPLFRVSLGGG